MSFGEGAIAPDPHPEPRHLAHPSLIIYGERDNWVAKRELGWDRQESKAQFAVIAKAGHVAVLDNPDCVNQTLLAFLRELDG